MVAQTDHFTGGCDESVCDLTLEKGGLLNLQSVDLVDVLCGLVTQHGKAIRPQTLMVLHEKGQTSVSDDKHIEVQVTFEGELAKWYPLIALSLFFKCLNQDLFDVIDGPCVQDPWV